jgi:Chlorophyll A-B binding protein.
MAKLSIALTTAAALASSANAFAPSKGARSVTSALSATGFEEVGGKPWDPLSLGKLEDANDTFPNMFPKSQYLQESEIKHGRMCMLAWTGVWATHVVSFNLGPFLSVGPRVFCLYIEIHSAHH